MPCASGPTICAAAESANMVAPPINVATACFLRLSDMSYVFVGKRRILTTGSHGRGIAWEMGQPSELDAEFVSQELPAEQGSLNGPVRTRLDPSPPFVILRDRTLAHG